MRVVVHSNGADHQRVFGAAMKAGIERHGHTVEWGGFDRPSPCDAAVIWGWKQPAVVAAAPHTLVMERGHLQPREGYVSCGWDGLGGRARYPKAQDGGKRWRELFDDGRLAPWRFGAGDYTLILGQVPGDAALAGVDYNAWVERTTKECSALGPVVYRPHPLTVRGGGAPVPLAEDLARASLAVAFNSTSAVEAVLAGVPTVTADRGAMAWPVSSHSVAESPLRPLRLPWCYDMSWTGWTFDEILSGDAWAAAAPVMHEG